MKIGDLLNSFVYYFTEKIYQLNVFVSTCIRYSLARYLWRLQG